MLKIKNLTAYYNNHEVIKEINCLIKSNEIVALIGTNGAGKSTLLKIISGILKPKQGTIVYNNKQILGLPPYKIVSLGISHSQEGRKVFQTLSVLENLIIGSYRCKKIDKAQLELVYSIFPKLKDRSKQLAGTLSGGEQQMLAIGRALMAKPQLLLLDEPSLGLSPNLSKELFILIKKINQLQNISILLVEQNAKVALKLSNYAYVLDLGKIIIEGKSQELLQSSQIQKAYLGNL